MAEKEKRLFSRRDFLVGTGAVIVSGAATAIGCSPRIQEVPVEKEVLVEKIVEKQVPFNPPTSAAYLVVDSKKCAGCSSCMFACSMVHDGKANLSTSRIQITTTALAAFPYDLEMNQCRQCPDPLCVQNCPTGAMHVDAANGNIRTVDDTKCIGCGLCLAACPQTAHRTVWNSDTKKSTKCDLCANTPFWNEKGGPDGKQACVEVCPMGALSLVKAVPSQVDSSGYDVNLRAKKA